MRLIDADALKEYLDICECCDNCPNKKLNCNVDCTLPDCLTNDWERIINEQPTVQTEIIRCKDCKHSEHWYKDKRRCFLWAEDGIDVFEDGYCNYAEGKEE